MTGESTKSAPSEITLAYIAAVERLTQHVQIVQDILDEIREELQWAVRNHEPIRFDRLPTTDEEWNARLNPERRYPFVPESVSCSSCDNACDSLQEALLEGWEGLMRDDGLSWNFLGTCPACREEERAEFERLNARRTAEPPPDDESSAASTQRELF